MSFRPRARLLATVLLLLAGAGAGCQAPAGLPGGPPNPAAVALQDADVPTGLARCPGSGGIDGYLAAIRTVNPDSYAGTLDAWHELQSLGAQDGAIVVYSEDPTNCASTLGAGKGQSATSFVLRYRDADAATAAYKKGILSFPTPKQGQQTPGLTVGAATGLGPNGWVFDQAVQGRAAYLAFWQSRSFDILFLTSDLDPQDSRRAAHAIDSRTG